MEYFFICAFITFTSVKALNTSSFTVPVCDDRLI